MNIAQQTYVESKMTPVEKQVYDAMLAHKRLTVLAQEMGISFDEVKSLSQLLRAKVRVWRDEWRNGSFPIPVEFELSERLIVQIAMRVNQVIGDYSYPYQSFNH